METNFEIALLEGYDAAYIASKMISRNDESNIVKPLYLEGNNITSVPNPNLVGYVVISIYKVEYKDTDSDASFQENMMKMLREDLDNVNRQRNDRAV